LKRSCCNTIIRARKINPEITAVASTSIPPPIVRSGFAGVVIELVHIGCSSSFLTIRTGGWRASPHRQPEPKSTINPLRYSYFCVRSTLRRAGGNMRPRQCQAAVWAQIALLRRSCYFRRTPRRRCQRPRATCSTLPSATSFRRCASVERSANSSSVPGVSEYASCAIVRVERSSVPATEP
jgi:hypothetical protein